MFDYRFLFDLLYSLAAQDGRDRALFGTSLPQAREAFARSLAGNEFPELWYEIPLLGEPWFDLHVLTARTALEDACATESAGEDTPCAGRGFAEHPELFTWFAQVQSGRQLALSWDVGSGTGDNPAVQLLRERSDDQAVCEFLQVAGRPDAIDSFRTFAARLPEEWFACYYGVFPERPGLNLRVECIPTPDLQRAYADDATLLEEHLRQTGFDDLGDTIVPRCQYMAGLPFQFEFQFDVRMDGSADTTLGASSRFSSPAGEDFSTPFQTEGAAGAFMQQVEARGLADSRWRRLEETTFSKRVSAKGNSVHLVNYPAFIKLRWRDGQPLDAKAYLLTLLR